jgi:hypothetical protein
LICPVIHDFNVNAVAGEVRRQHQARRTSANDAYLACGGWLWETPEQSKRISGVLIVDGGFKV